MRGRVFLFSFFLLALPAGLTQPALLAPFLATPAAPAPATRAPAATPRPTATPDLLAAIPTATRIGSRARIVVIQRLPAPPPPDLPLTPAHLPLAAVSPPTPTSAPLPPERIRIPRLGLDAPVEPVSLQPDPTADGVSAWAVPDHRAAGWLDRSAPFARSGNTVLDGHHNIAGEVFRNLWELQAGDDILLSAAGQTRLYRVNEVFILPDREQPAQVRLANARYIRPTADERLTLVTCYPYESNTHRVIVIALPQEAAP